MIADAKISFSRPHNSWKTRWENRREATLGISFEKPLGFFWGLDFLTVGLAESSCPKQERFEHILQLWPCKL